ncbi:DUF2948 family protein [Maricaulis sp. D1M11]|uniref:DUF2948 family protein n=1 Tax=Maricaulis sp. D1M11 TaxID=3076117 RepID=UPI0039B3CEB6
MARPPSPLKLQAHNRDDVTVLSAALQDAIIRLGDIEHDRKARTITFAANRYCWECDTAKRGWRVRAGVQIAGITQVQSRNIRQGASDAVINLLQIRFEGVQTDESPEGELILVFSGDGELRIAVECLDMVMADVSEPWLASQAPDHDADEAGTTD